MKLNRLLAINAAFALLTAAGFVLAPAQMLGHLGASNASGQWVARELGGAVIGYAVLAWLARGAQDLYARRAIALALCVSWAAGFVIALLRQFSGVAAPSAWGAVVIYLLFALGYGFWLARPATRLPASHA